MVLAAAPASSGDSGGVRETYSSAVAVARLKGVEAPRSHALAPRLLARGAHSAAADVKCRILLVECLARRGAAAEGLARPTRRRRRRFSLLRHAYTMQVVSLSLLGVVSWCCGRDGVAVCTGLGLGLGWTRPDRGFFAGCMEGRVFTCAAWLNWPDSMTHCK